MKLRLVLLTAAVLFTATSQLPATPAASEAARVFRSRVGLTQGPASTEPGRRLRARPMRHVEAVLPAVVLRRSHALGQAPLS